MLVFRTRALPALMIATVSVAAGAQQKACEIDEGQPAQVARAMLDLQMMQSSNKPEDAAKALRDAIKLLSEGDQKRNPVGRAFVMGKTLVSWMAQPSMASGYSPRAALGFTTDPTGNYDLVAGIDSAFSVVEASNPDCLGQTAGWRQQKAWVDMVNKAFELSNEGGAKTDSAVVIAKRSLQLYKNAPYAYMVLAKGAAEKNNAVEAISQYKQAIAVSSKDTAASVVDMRRQVLMTLGNFAADLYEAGTGDKAMLMTEAKAAYDALAKDPGTKYADAARAGQARLAQMSGDVNAIKATYADQLANPGAFSYASLMGAAVTAAKSCVSGRWAPKVNSSPSCFRNSSVSTRASMSTCSSSRGPPRRPASTWRSSSPLSPQIFRTPASRWTCRRGWRRTTAATTARAGIRTSTCPCSRSSTPRAAAPTPGRP